MYLSKMNTQKQSLFVQQYNITETYEILCTCHYQADYGYPQCSNWPFYDRKEVEEIVWFFFFCKTEILCIQVFARRAHGGHQQRQKSEGE